MSEPDYEAIAERRAEERGERWLARLDALYGRVEDHLSRDAARGDPE